MLEMLKEKRSNRLEESGRLFRFLRECDAVMEWLGEQTAIAASEDYGQDVEHVEILIQKFDSFMASLTANENKVENIKQVAKELVQDKHPQPDKINDKVRTLM